LETRTNLGAFTAPAGTREITIDAEGLLVTSTVGNALTFDRINNVAYWIGTQHAIESLDFPNRLSFLTYESYDWRERSPIRRPTAGSPLYVQIPHTVSPILWDLPNSNRPLHRVAAGTILMVLTSDVDFDYSFVLYQNPTTGVYRQGYINNRFLTAASNYAISTDIFDEPGADRRPEDMNSGRVILNGVIIFKYPAALDFNLSVGTVAKNFNARHSVIAFPAPIGLYISRRITIPDALGFEFFEVPLSFVNGSWVPRPDGEYVGFVDVQWVINYHEHPSLDEFSPNANINLNPFPGTEFAQVYRRPGLEPLYGERLSHSTEIFVRRPFDRNQEWTWVQYWDEELQSISSGYVRTMYISTGGLTTWQLLGIILAIAALIVAIVFVVRHIVKKKAQE